MTAMLISNVSIFDGAGAAPFPGQVLIEGERIKIVAKGSEVIDAPGAEIIDGEGGTLTPGLIEPHSHLTFPNAVDRLVRNFMPPVEEHAYITAHNAKTLLDYGYTSAFSGGATNPRIEVKLRDEIAAGFLPGPRIKAASFERSVQGNSGPNSRSASPGVEEIEKFCREMIELGVDSFKFVVSGAGSVFPQNFDTLSYTSGELALAARIAKENGKNLLGHCYSSESIALAVRFGFDAIYHCNFADEATLDLMEQNKDKFVVVPAVGIIEAGLTKADLVPDGAPERHPDAQQGLKMIDEGQRKVIPAMRKRGIRVLPGGDYGFAHNPHGREAWELELFQSKFGFEPAEILSAATQGGAWLMRMADEIGLVKAGYLADLVLVDGDPLSDITLFQDKDALRFVMKAGKFHKFRTGNRATQRVAAE
jgi:imidazolonepropionase-like amidohydrolase